MASGMVMHLSGRCARACRSWYQAPEDGSYQGQVDLAAAGLNPVVKVALTGGHFWLQADFDINTAGRHVLDFKNTSVIGHFRHIILDAQLHPVTDLQGGIAEQRD